jgi:hypothetical protein
MKISIKRGSNCGLMCKSKRVWCALRTIVRRLVHFQLTGWVFHLLSSSEYSSRGSVMLITWHHPLVNASWLKRPVRRVGLGIHSCTSGLPTKVDSSSFHSAKTSVSLLALAGMEIHTLVGCLPGVVFAILALGSAVVLTSCCFESTGGAVRIVSGITSLTHCDWSAGTRHRPTPRKHLTGPSLRFHSRWGATAEPSVSHGPFDRNAVRNNFRRGCTTCSWTCGCKAGHRRK